MRTPRLRRLVFPAVLVIASAGGADLHAFSVFTEPENAVERLAKIIVNDGGARADAGHRIADFLLKADAAQKSFVATGVDTVALGAVARNWALQTDPRQVAMFYFVAGPGGGTPIWAQRDWVLSKTFQSGTIWEIRLRMTLADWTDKNQIAKTAANEVTIAFLNDAAAKAATVFYDRRTQEELSASILSRRHEVVAAQAAKTAQILNERRGPEQISGGPPGLPGGTGRGGIDFKVFDDDIPAVQPDLLGRHAVVPEVVPAPTESPVNSRLGWGGHAVSAVELLSGASALSGFTQIAGAGTLAIAASPGAAVFLLAAGGYLVTDAGVRWFTGTGLSERIYNYATKKWAKRSSLAERGKI